MARVNPRSSAAAASPGQQWMAGRGWKPFAFQREVWRALRAIPVGSTITYADLAASLGRRGSARAVGAACGANPLAIIVPCHRVVARDGSLTGYRWGVERKQALLKREAEMRASR